MQFNNSLAALFLIITFLCSSIVADSYRYLAVLPSVHKSQFLVGEALMKALAAKGNKVYVISPFPQETAVSNYFDISFEFTYDESDATRSSYSDGFLKKLFLYLNGEIGSSEYVLNDEKVQDLMKYNNTYDAIICEIFQSELLFGLSEHFGAPLIGLSTFGSATTHTDMVGSPSPISYVPYYTLALTDHMSLYERFINMWYVTLDQIFMDYYYLPHQAALYRKYFPYAKRDLYEVRKNAALVFVNRHVSFSYPRPYMPNHVEVGGLHIDDKRTPLPNDIKKFIEESEHGVIYFAMGSYLGDEDLANEIISEFAAAFRQLKQRVIWRLDNFVEIEKPENVLTAKWFPQNDILAHVNVKVFITHCGLLSTIESIHHGVPMIGIPLYRDQFYNMAKAEADGIAIKLDFQTLIADDIVEAVDLLIKDETYTSRVKEISKRYKDRPISPKDLAVFWVEHISRQKGAKYLHCAGLDLSFIEYHNLDAYTVIITGTLVLALFIVGPTISIIRCFTRSIRFWRSYFLRQF